MTNWPSWLRPGLAVTLLLALLALFIRSGAVEEDLRADVVARLSAAGHEWARVTASGRGVEVSGTAPSIALRTDAIELAAATQGVAGVADRTELLALASPYVWSARRTGGVVAISGFVPSESARNLVLAEGRRSLPEAEIHDGMELARGASPAFNARTAFALEQLAALAEGNVTLTDDTLSVSGVAADPASYAGARAVLSDALPDGAMLGPVDILPARADPFVWSATLDDAGITLSGFVPNEVIGEALVADAAAVLPEPPIDDRTRVASGEPDGFEAAARFGLQALARLEEGGVTLEGDTLHVAGVAKSVEAYEAVTQDLAGPLPANITLVADDITPATVSAYEWRGEKRGNEVVLSGYAPSLQSRAALTEARRSIFSGMSVTDNVRVAAGAPKMDWVGAVEFAMTELTKLDHGSVVVGDRTFSIEGEAADPEAYEILMEETARTLPASLELVGANIVPPEASPYRLVVERTPSRVRIAGFAPTDEERQEIAGAARRTFAAARITSSVILASGAPQDYVAAAAGMMRMVARLSSGGGEVTDSKVSIGGTVYSTVAAAEIDAMSKEEVPEGFRPDVSVIVHQVGTPLSPEECAERLESQGGAGRIEFIGGKADVSAASYGMLDRVSATLLRCPDAIVEVGAHSDADGSEQSNLELTESRAEAVVDYLVDAGVRRERLIAVGYGEAKPIADNETPEGKAANRRVEFAISGQEGG